MMIRKPFLKLALELVSLQADSLKLSTLSLCKLSKKQSAWEMMSVKPRVRFLLSMTICSTDLLLKLCCNYATLMSTLSQCSLKMGSWLSMRLEIGAWIHSHSFWWMLTCHRWMVLRQLDRLLLISSRKAWLHQPLLGWPETLIREQSTPELKQEWAKSLESQFGRTSSWGFSKECSWLNELI